MKKEIAQGLTSLAEWAVKKAVIRTSPWNHYQPKESETIKKWVQRTK